MLTKFIGLFSVLFLVGVVYGANNLPGLRSDSLSIGVSAAPNASSIVDIRSTTKGVLLPRMSNVQVNGISAPVEGLLAYDNTNHEIDVYNGSAWQKMFDAANLTGTLPPGALPTPAVAALGGVFSHAAVSHNFLTSINTDGSVTGAQPAFSDITGTATAAQLPTPTASTIGGVESYVAVSNQWINAISTAGVPSSTQPSFSNISGVNGLAAGGTNANLSATGAAHNVLEQVSSGAAITVGQLAFTDISGTLGVTAGGSGLTSSVLGDLWYGSGSNTMAALSGNTTSTSKMLVQTGTGSVSAAPVWQTDGNFITNLNASNVATGTVPWTRISQTDPTNGAASAPVLLFNGTNFTGGTATTTKPSILIEPSGTTSANWNTSGTMFGVNSASGSGADLLNLQRSGADVAKIDWQGNFTTLQSVNIGAVSNFSGLLNLNGVTSGTVGITVPSAPSSYTLTLPSAQGSSQTTLLNDGSGNLSWGQAAGSGTKNYLGTINGANNNGNFETNSVSPWVLGHASLTSAFPSGVPTFGSGASGNFTEFTTAVNLAGSYSLAVDSSSATTAGDFLASPAFTIDTEDQAKVMTIKFYYKSQSGGTNNNYSGTSSNSFGIAIYDVTNSAWIMPAGVWNIVQSSGVGYSTATFQTTSNSTSYRLVVFNANATAGAERMIYDDFFLGPQTAPMGPAMTDWKNDKTFTPSAGFGTVSSTNYWYRRIGDSAEVTLIFTSGTAAASTASIALPFTIDSTKLPSSSTVVGTAFREVNSASRTMWSNNDPAVVFYDGSTTGSVYLTNADGAQTLTKTNVSSMFSTGDLLSVTFTVPVSGWSSNSVMSSDTDTRVVAFQGAVNQTINNTTPSLTPTVNYDTHGAFATSTYTVPVTGKYHLHGWLRSPSIAWTAGQTIEIYYSKNGGANITVGRTVMTATTNIAQASFSDMVDAKAGDTLLLKAYSDVSGTFTGNYNIDRLSGPAVVAATESVNARYTNTSGQSITNSGADVKITGWTKDFDTHSAVSGDTYTVPVSGKYQACVTVNYASAAWAASNQAIVDIYKNGAVQAYGAFSTAFASVTTQMGASGCTILNDVAGDTIDFRTANTRTAGATTLAANASQVFFTITRVGN